MRIINFEEELSHKGVEQKHVGSGKHVGPEIQSVQSVQFTGT